MKSVLAILALFTVLSCGRNETRGNISNPDIDKLVSFDVNLGEPQVGDWLYVHKEPGQTFEEYVDSEPVSPTSSRNRIYLLPLGRFSKIDSNLIAHTATYLHHFFSLETMVLPAVSDSIIPDKARRGIGDDEQFLTGFIMDHLERTIPDDAIVFMAITSTDLYPSDRYNFVFGQARLKDRVAVSSFNRFLDAQLDSSNFSLCLSRLIKTSSHEISHMLNCLHCTNAVCVMNGSNDLWEADSRPNRLCAECLRKLQWNLGFDVKARVTAIKNYFSMHHIEWDFDHALRDELALK